MDTNNSKLIFAYNADSGLFNALTDSAHKLISPDTYSCNLCAITYGMFGMKKEWKDFLKSISSPIEFLHRNEFEEKYKIKNIELPAIFTIERNSLQILIDAPSINKCKSIKDLKELINEKEL